MSRKIEEIFDLPPANAVEEDDINSPITQEETGFDLSMLQDTLEIADRINHALPMVRDLNSLDADMDNYAEQAMKAFKDLMDLGQNVDDRNAAAIFDVAGKMMTNAISAKTAKAEKKLKMLDLQLRKARLDLDTKKVDAILVSKTEPEEGVAEEFEDRNSLINAVLDKLKSNNS
jgi:hypothetical protein